MRRRSFLLAVTGAPAALAATGPVSIFARDNLVAWCIVPFDAAKRGPKERADMLSALGISKFAYDWREKDIPDFETEIDELNRRSIELTAFWVPTGLEPENNKTVQLILDLFERKRVKPQIWVTLDGPATRHVEGQPTQEAKVAAAAKPVGYLADRGAKLGCMVALYNHGGWFGEPENQIAIIRYLKKPNVGIVYNFHHAHKQLDRFPELFAMMKPHLAALNINGTRAGGPMILPVGAGDRELEMLRLVQASGWKGPLGILGHRAEVDARESLTENIEGLKKLLARLGDQAALKTY